MRENLKSGSVRGVKQPSMVEYCGTPHIEREEKQRIQSIPKEGGYDVYSTESFSIAHNLWTHIFSYEWGQCADTYTK